jgi:acetylornithine deacetylase
MHSGIESESSTTVNVGRISGGTNINVVPSECDVWWEIRQGEDEDATSLKTTVEKLLDDAATPLGLRPITQEIIMIPALNRANDNRALALAKMLGAKPAETPLSFGTEAGFFQRVGIPSIVCGPGSIEQAHKPDEWIAIDQLERASGFLDQVVEWATVDHDRGNLQ